MEKRMLFVFNPKAGKGKIKSCLWEILSIFNAADYEVIARATQFSGDAREQAKKYAGQVDLIVCSGGDGTLDEVVSGLIEIDAQVPVGYIPAGSTNDFANSLFMPKNMVEVAHNIMLEQPYFCDVGRFNDSTFAYIAAFGIFTEVSYATDQALKNALGHMAYLLEGIKSLSDIQCYHMRVVSDELTVEDDFIYGMITNSRSVGGFKNLTGKHVDMNDGLFEVTLVVMPRNPLELNEIITSMLTATDNTNLVHTFKTRHISIDSDQEMTWTLDGEYGGTVSKVEIEVLHNALQLYLKSTRAEKKVNLLEEIQNALFPTEDD
ncbi:MAG: diacylglycerol kinase family lipid kinase [Blautia sp.]|nr:diacylglycerol kinase family lipid kinase [Blautia sp.]